MRFDEVLGGFLIVACAAATLYGGYSPLDDNAEGSGAPSVQMHQAVRPSSREGQPLKQPISAALGSNGLAERIAHPESASSSTRWRTSLSYAGDTRFAAGRPGDAMNLPKARRASQAAEARKATTAQQARRARKGRTARQAARALKARKARKATKAADGFL